jgi:phospholipase D1/2
VLPCKVCPRECELPHFPLIYRQREAVGAVGDIIHTDAGKVFRKVVGQSNNLEPLESDTGDKFLEEERMMESRDHQKVHGFPSSIVPTMEEKVVIDTMDSIPEDSGSSRTSKGEEGGSERSQQPQNGGAQEPRENASSASSTPVEARVDNGELYGAPADASRDPKTDDQPPHAVSGKNDATEVEEKAVHARAEIRKHLSSKLNPRVWTLPTPTPKVDPHGFEDPISDEFWKKVWMACAVHNVKALVVTCCWVVLRPFYPLD